MNLSEFTDKIKYLNNGSYSFGNDILYKMAASSLDLSDSEKLEGAIWLIGRAYAASPQRRSYGTTENNKNNDKYVNLSGNANLQKRPCWPVKTQNDGREGFFDAIANNLDTSCVSGLDNRKYKFDATFQTKTDKKGKTSITGVKLSNDDKNLLKDTIKTVLDFNENLSRAIEAFDELPQNYQVNGKKVECNNHISFASKFLHFYFPNAIFIIDGFAFNGACALWSGDPDKNKRYLVDASKNDDHFEKDVYDQFPKVAVRIILEELFDNASDADEEITESEDSDNVKKSHYAAHCVRSYLMGCFLTPKGIVPISHIKGDQDFKPMPRLVDTVFLNIKKPLTDKEINYIDCLERIYYAPNRN